MSFDRFCPHATICASGAISRSRAPYTFTTSAYRSAVNPLFIGSLSIWNNRTPYGSGCPFAARRRPQSVVGGSFKYRTHSIAYSTCSRARSRRRQHDQRLGVQLPAQPEKLVRPEPKVIRVPAPEHIGMIPARDIRPDAFLPFIRRRERPARPPDERRREIAQRLQQVGPQHPVPPNVRPHHRNEVDQRRPIPRRGDLHRSLRIAHRTRERKPGLLPPRARDRKRRRRDRLAFRAHDPQRQLRRSLLPSHPRRPVIRPPVLDEDPPLPDARAPAVRPQSHAPLPVRELDVRDFNGPALRERSPVRLEIRSLETRPANLFREQPVLDRVIDMFEELPVNPPIDRSRNAIRIHQQHGHAPIRSGCRHRARRNRAQKKPPSIHPMGSIQPGPGGAATARLLLLDHGWCRCSSPKTRSEAEW